MCARYKEPVYRAAPEPRAWMPGQEQSWALGLVPPASAQAIPIVQPTPPPSSPPHHCAACFSLLQSLHQLPHSPHTESGGHFLCVWPWCGRSSTLAFQALSPAWQNPLALAVGGGWELGVFLSLATEGKLRLRMQAVP